MKYFANIKTLDDLKKEFRRLAMIHHPDRGGDVETMKEINNEYDMMFPMLKAATAAQSTETAQSTRSEFYTANGWKGERYEAGRSLKEIAQLVRAYIKEFFPDYRFSVRTSYASMCQELHVDMKEAPADIFKAYEEMTDDDISECRRKATRNSVWTLNSWNKAESKAPAPAVKSEDQPQTAPAKLATLRVEFNAEFDGIEVYFTSKPSQETRDALKAAGYCWHSVKKCWYAKRSEERLQALKKIEGAA